MRRDWRRAEAPRYVRILVTIAVLFRSKTTLAIALAAASALISVRSTYEPDLWYHLAQGREAASGHLVRTNVFSFIAPDFPQSYTPWLFDLIVYLAWRLGGGLPIQILQTLFVSAALLLIYGACRQRAPMPAALAVMLLGLFVLEPRVLPRPHLASFAGLAACSLAIERARATKSARPLRWTIPLIALWSNLHVESVFGVALVGIFAAAEAIRPSAFDRRESARAIAIACGCALATLITPYGWGLERYLIENARVPQLLDIAELQAPYMPSYKAFFAYVAIGGALLLLTIRTLTLWEAVAAMVFAVLGFRYLRFTPLVFIVTAPMLADRVARFIGLGLDRRAAVAASAVAAALLSRQPIATLPSLVRAGTDAVRPADFFSPDAAAFARRVGLRGPLFNSNNLGGYLAWELYPVARVFQDSRFQAYPPDHFRAILDASRSQSDWDALVAGVEWAVLSIPRVNDLSGAGRFPRAQWATVYWDEAVEMMVRRGGPFSDVIAAHEYTIVWPNADPMVLAPQISGSDRLRAEAARNRRENPNGFVAAALVCLAGSEPDACAAADRMGAERPRLAAAAEQLRRIRLAK